MKPTILKELWRRWRPSRRIVDHSRRRPGPERLPQHWAYAAWFTCAILGALWQHGHPTFTLTILALIPLLTALAYVPYRLLPSGFRFLLQLLTVAAAGLWLLFRMRHNVPIDKAMAELLALSGLSFLMAQTARDYGYLFAIGIILLLYGTLLPRATYLISFGVGLILLLYLLYCNRIRSLAGAPDLASPRSILRRNWHFIILHLGLSTVFFYLIFSLLPTRPTATRGIFAVSFLHNKESLLPVNLQQWLDQEKTTQAPTGQRIIRTGKPDSLGSTGTPLNLRDQQSPPAGSATDGGSAPPGNELVFRVKSPLKLYHLAQLYDLYDGTKWTVSPQLLRGRIRQRRLPEQRLIFQDVAQHYTIFQWFGPKLYAAFRLFSIEPLDSRNEVDVQHTAFNAQLAGKHYPQLPFRYQAISRIVTSLPRPDLSSEDLPKIPIDRWDELLPRRHYLKLPRDQISRRLRDLVSELTAGAEDDYDRALRLRDYLRNNFSYRQFSDPVPAGRETADFFVFELKSGHCEYFALTLAVMARIAGLPARVATGFSPGDYNTLNNTFEVYEKHAHAWTQIFIEKYGWLTFDATPPGAVESRTKPLALGRLRDPFGDEWRVTPPELTRQTLETVRNAFLRSLEEAGELEATPTEQALARMMQAEEQLREQVRDAYHQVAREIQPTTPQTSPIRRLREQLTELGNRVRTGLRQFGGFLLQHYPGLCALLPMAAAGILFCRLFRRERRKRRLQTALRDQLSRSTAALRSRRHRDAVTATYRAARILLELAGKPRQRNEELLAYAERLGQSRPILAQLLLPLFQNFYQVAYSEESPERETALRMLRRVRALRRELRPELPPPPRRRRL